LIITWIGVSAVAVIYAFIVRIDAQKDLDARHLAGTNSGKEILAKLVRTMGTLKIIAFTTWLLTGLYAISPWSLNAEGPIWRRLIFPIGMNIGLVCVAASLFLFQHERKRVLVRDTASELERLRRLAAVERDLESRDALTAATNGLAQATREQTEALAPNTAQAENTESIQELTTATEANTTAIKVETLVTLHKNDEQGDVH
jgi:hypothetical protein